MPPPPPSDGDLVRAFLAGDLDGFSTLYERYFPGVHDFLSRLMRDRQEGADLAQDAFIKAMEQLPALHSPEKFKSWLFSIAHNTALNRIRQSQRNLRAISAVDDEERASLAIADPDPMIDPEQMAEAQQAADIVWDAAAALDERTYTVLDLHVRHGLQSAEIAQVLGVSKGNAYTMVSRMKDRFSEVLATVLLVRKGRGECADLAQMIGADIDAVTPEVRRRADRHVATCQDCARNRALYLEPLRVFAGLLLVPVPAGLQAAVWGAVAAGAGGAAVAGEAAGGGAGAAGVAAAGTSASVEGAAAAGGVAEAPGVASAASGAAAAGAGVGAVPAVAAAVALAATLGIGGFMVMSGSGEPPSPANEVTTSAPVAAPPQPASTTTSTLPTSTTGPPRSTGTTTTIAALPDPSTTTGIIPPGSTTAPPPADPTTTSAPAPPPAPAPVAVDDIVIILEDELATVDVLANDDDDLDPDTLEIVIDPQAGSASVTTDAEIVYTPDADFVGVDILTYEVADRSGNTARATLEITVEAVNELPN